MNDSNTFCIIPWIHIVESTHGNFFPCCNSRNRLPIEKGTSINDAFNSEVYNELRDDTITNKKSKYCEVCWDKEENNIRSYRHIYNNKFNELYNVGEEPNLSYFDLKFDNKCNLMCRMCNPSNSNQIWKTIDQYKNENKKLPSFLKPFQLEERHNPRYKNKKEELLNNINSIKFLKVTGGEPLLSDDFIEVIDILIKKKLAQNVILEITTNGTLFNKNILEKFSSFKRVTINISVDGIESSYDYIRYPYNWKNWVMNLERLLNYVQDEKIYNKIHIRFSCVVLSYNWLCLGKLYSFLKDYCIEYKWISWFKDKLEPRIHFDFNLVPKTLVLGISSLSDEIIDIGFKRFYNNASESRQINEFKIKSNEYKNNDIQKNLKEFKEVTCDFDKYRNQSYKNLDPILGKYIDGL